MSCKRNPGGSLTAGLIIVAVGVVLLLGQIGVLDIRMVWRFWPAIFCLAGLSTIIGADQPAQRLWGGFLVLFGGILIIHNLGYLHYGMRQLWPLFLIGA